MSSEVIFNHRFSLLEVSLSKRQVNIASNNTSITFWCYSSSLFGYYSCNLSFL
jgi:hypothetical protein